MRGFGKDEQRAVIQNFNLAMLSVTFASYGVAGLIEAKHLPLFAIILPAMLVPSLLGARLYIGISPEVFRRVLLSLITLSGAALLVAAIPALAGR